MLRTTRVDPEIKKTPIKGQLLSFTDALCPGEALSLGYYKFMETKCTMWEERNYFCFPNSISGIKGGTMGSPQVPYQEDLVPTNLGSL